MANTPQNRKSQGGIRPGRTPGTFTIDYTDHNRIRRRVTCRASKKSEAIKFRNSILLQRDRIKAGLEQAPEKIEAVPTLRDLWKKFERNRKIKIKAGSLSKNTLHRCKNAYNNLLLYEAELQYKRIDKIKSDDIEGFKIHRTKIGKAPSGVNIDLIKLKSIFNFAARQGIVTTTPFADVSEIKTPKKDVRFLNDEELLRLHNTLQNLDLCDEFFKDAHDLVLFYLYTGARTSEPLYPIFRWEDTNGKSIRFPQTKGKKSREIPKLQAVEKILDSRKNIEGGPFHFDRGMVYKRVRRIMIMANIKATTHDLRRTAGAWYYMATKDIFATSRYLGHSSVQVTERSYTGLIQSLKIEYAEKFENLLNQQMTNK